MITLYDFLAMTDAEQGVAAMQGEYLALRDEGDQKVQLYNLGSFFVEVYYDPKLNKITQLQPSKNKRVLQKYVQHLDLIALLNKN
jgi:hypothetical protein